MQTTSTKTSVFLLTIVVFLIGSVNTKYPRTNMAGIWYVSTSGNDSHSCTSPSAPCATIDSAIQKASPGDTILVSTGSYTVSQMSIVNISKNITLSGGWNSAFTVQNGYSIIDGTKTNYTIIRGITVFEGVTSTVRRFIVKNIPGSVSSYELNSGIYNAGTLILEDSIVHDNSTSGDGGGIYNSGVMTITQSVITGNYASYTGGGIYNNARAKATLYDCSVTENSSYLNGAGIFTANDGIVDLINTTISNNIVSYSFANNVGGGGLASYYGVFNLINSIVSDNQAKGNGGGIVSHGTLTMVNSVVRNNSSPALGGGIFIEWGNATITNSTISDNFSTDAGGGLYQAWGSHLTLYSSTVSHNRSGAGGGIVSEDGTSFQNTIIADNTGGANPECQGTFTSLGYNIVKNTDNCTVAPQSGDLLNVDPKIANLVSYLGYNPLAPTSPAIDAGDPSGCKDEIGIVLTRDQRNASRQGRCDIGSYEYVSPNSTTRVLPIGGNAQKTVVNTLFADPLSALVVDGLGSPVHNTSVIFSAPVSDTSAVFMSTGTYSQTVETDPWGIVTSSLLKANGLAGSYQVTATENKTGLFTSFSLTNIGKHYLPTTVCKYCFDFFDDFSNPASGWLVINDEFVKTEYIEGEFRVLTKQKGYLYLFKAPTCARPAYVMEADIRWEEKTGSSYGLVFGIQGNFDQYYVFDINTDYQMYRLYRYDGGNFYMITGPAATPAIHTGIGSNHLKVTRNGTTIILEINGTVQGSWTDNNITGITSMGILVSPYNQTPRVAARFDNVTVRMLPVLLQSEPLKGTQEPYLGLPELKYYRTLWTELNWQVSSP